MAHSHLLPRPQGDTWTQEKLSFKTNLKKKMKGSSWFNGFDQMLPPYRLIILFAYCSAHRETAFPCIDSLISCFSARNFAEIPTLSTQVPQVADAVPSASFHLNASLWRSFSRFMHFNSRSILWKIEMRHLWDRNEGFRWTIVPLCRSHTLMQLSGYRGHTAIERHSFVQCCFYYLKSCAQQWPCVRYLFKPKRHQGQSLKHCR